MFLRAESRVSMIVIGALPAIERSSLSQVAGVACRSLVFKVDAHHVLEVVTA